MRTKPNRKWYGHITVALVVEGGQKVAGTATGQTVDLIEASVELEGLDSITEERIIAAIDTRQANKVTRKKNSRASWEPIKDIIEF